MQDKISCLVLRRSAMTSLWQSKHDNTIKQQYYKCKSPKVKLPKISRVQKVDKPAILQVQKSKGQTPKVSRLQKVDKAAILQRSTKQQYCKCKSPKVKLPKISRVQKVHKTAILQVQKVKYQECKRLKTKYCRYS